MIKNYFKVAIRNILKTKVFSLVNVFGLAIGLSSCLFIYLFVEDELSFDRHHEHSNRIMRVALDRIYPTNTVSWAPIAPGVGPGFAESLPEIETVTRISKGQVRLMVGDKQFQEKSTIYVDPTFLDVFTLNLIEGDRESAIKSSKSLMISHSLALKYFDGEKALGKTVIVNDTASYQVTGVFEDIPSTSHLHYDVVMHMDFQNFNRHHVWNTAFFFYTYILLDENAEWKTVNSKLAEVTKTYLFDDEAAYQKWINEGNNYSFFLQPLTKIHLTSNLKWEFQSNGDITYVNLFSIVALFILLIACINYVNLSTAKASKRAKEIGLRKVLGSFRRQIFGQFVMESIIIAGVAMFIAVTLTQISMPFFNDLVNKQISLIYFLSGEYLLAIILFTLLIGSLAGFYPAIVLSGFKPSRVLSASSDMSSTRSGFRNTLVIIQFVVTVVLIVGTLGIFLQMQFMQNKKLGYNKDQIVVVENIRQLGAKKNSLKEELLKHADIQQVAISGQALWETTGASTFSPKDNPNQISINMVVMGGDYNILETYDIDIIAGRYLTEADGQRGLSMNVMLNQAAIKALGWTLEDVDNQLTNSGGGMKANLVGIMKDFNFESLHNEIKPLMFMVTPWAGVASVKINAGQISSSISQIESTWKSLTDEPFVYSFADQKIQAMYATEKTMGKLFIVFSSLAILVACLGLFGLVTYVSESRTQEIGIRKVMGASVKSIIGLLAKDFIKLLLIAIVIAIPISAYGLKWWLEGFAYRTSIPLWIYFVSAISAITISWITIGYQAFKAATVNPTRSLRSE